MPAVGTGLPTSIGVRLVERVAVALMVLLLLLGCSASPSVQTFGGEAMGTTWTAKVVVSPGSVAALQSALESELQRLTHEMSAWEPESSLSRFNRSAAGTWHRLPDDLYVVTDYALWLAQQTGGAYDPSVGPLVELWGFGPAGGRVEPPGSDETAVARSKVGWQKLQIDRDGRRLLQPGGMRLDVSSIGPGYAVDCLARRLRESGIDSFLLELGGEMRAGDRKPDGEAWRVGVENPATLESEAIDVFVRLENQAIASSGDYRSGFEHAGRRYSHTIDPRTSEPVEHALAAVSVIEATAMQADALAAALMVLGPDEGWALAESMRLAAVFSVRTQVGMKRRATPEFEKYRVP